MNKVNIEITRDELLALRAVLGLASKSVLENVSLEVANVVLELVNRIDAEMNPMVVAWIPRYMPFILGGDVHRPAKSSLPIEETLEVGKGFKVHRVIAPNGKDFYVESQTGGFLGDDLKMIKDDIEAGDMEVMQKQIVDSLKQQDKAQMMSAKLFWSYIKGSGAKRDVI